MTSTTSRLTSGTEHEHIAMHHRANGTCVFDVCPLNKRIEARDLRDTDHVTAWSKIEYNAPARLRYAVAGATGEANAIARLAGWDENDAQNPEWCEQAVNAYRQIAGQR